MTRVAPVTSVEVLVADRDGELDAALALAHQLQLAAGHDGGLSHRVEAFRLLARVRRHRGEPFAALESAGHAARLIRLPRLTTDERLAASVTLEVAACAVEAHDPSSAIGLAERWRHDDDPRLAARAWSVTGRALLERGDVDGAVSALCNAVAETERTPGHTDASWPRVLLGLALTRAAEARQAGRLLEEDLAAWAGGNQRRLRIGHGLVLAENRVARGRIAEAWALLKQVRRDLAACTGLGAEERLLYRLRAECLAAWGQVAEARGELSRIRTGDDGVTDHSHSRPHAPVPPRASPFTLGTDAGQGSSPVALLSRSSSRSRLQALVDPARSRDVERVRLILDDFATHRGTRTIEAASWLIAQIECLDGDPDEARAQAIAYVEAGAALRECRGGPFLLHSERALRRALTALGRLEGMGLWLARGRMELARTLHAYGRMKEALDHALLGVQELDGVRFLMQTRRHRDTWTAAEIGPSMDFAIELAFTCGDTTVASDLIVFSRTAGIVAPHLRDAGEADIPLLPVPRLHYIDGGVSSMGSGGECRFC
ncbi:hypothetical protein GCM10022275_29910 [Tessaracoccus defluvii]